MTVAVTIGAATTAADLEAMQALFREYQAWLGVDLCFQGFAGELADLAGRYAPPAGCLLLAKSADGDAAGGVGMWRLADGICEMKRLYVRPAWRGQGLGRRLAEAVISRADDAGYRRMRLDSLRRLTEALALYRALGFREIGAYYANPLADVVYLELDLSPPPAPAPAGRR
jgi:GNAT superfamily N-acetyltransferase